MAMRVRDSERAGLELFVNGEREQMWIEPTRLLCDLLRDDLGFTGVKVACGMANCGACTVLLDGTPIYSCITLAHDCRGRAVTTIEGLTGAEVMHPVQRAFIEKDAMQCGFCTPGQILTMSALLAKNPAPNEDEVRRAMSGNLCRCGAYVKILQAANRASELMQGASVAASDSYES